MTKKDRMILENVLEAHGENMDDLKIAMSCNNESMICGIYGSITGNKTDFYNVIMEFNFFYESKEKMLNKFKLDFDDDMCNYYDDFESYVNDCMVDVVKTKNGYVEILYY